MLSIKVFALPLLLLRPSNVLPLLTIYVVPMLYLVLYYFLVDYSILSATSPFLYLRLISALALSFSYISLYCLLVLLLVAILLAPLVEVVVVVVVIIVTYLASLSLPIVRPLRSLRLYPITILLVAF